MSTIEFSVLPRIKLVIKSLGISEDYVYCWILGNIRGSVLPTTRLLPNPRLGGGLLYQAMQISQDAYKRRAPPPLLRYPIFLPIHCLSKLFNLFRVHITDLGIGAISAGIPPAALILFLSFAAKLIYTQTSNHSTTDQLKFAMSSSENCVLTKFNNVDD